MTTAVNNVFGIGFYGFYKFSEERLSRFSFAAIEIAVSKDGVVFSSKIKIDVAGIGFIKL